MEVYDFGQIRIIGTSHIAKESIKQIVTEFESYKPDMVAVELDRVRLHGLLTGEKPSFHPKLIKQVGLSGYLFALIGSYVQKKLGNLVGMNPGSEMRQAALLARDNGRKLALIDQDVRITLMRISKYFTFRQKTRLFMDLLASPFSMKMRLDLSKVPEKRTVIFLLNLLKKRYPGLYKPLIEERNKFMASRLMAIVKEHPNDKILVVVGAGHVEGLIELLNKQTYLNKKVDLI